ncbi:hypothetical protein LCGC14_0387950 [marine sediment metagenome]|uniref:Uncharacterized protein n=1 Tax=marine sediment metagenome TaxID=412755 RepID=A0A0F9W9H8_9ZZZZ
MIVDIDTPKPGISQLPSVAVGTTIQTAGDWIPSVALTTIRILYPFNFCSVNVSPSFSSLAFAKRYVSYDNFHKPLIHYQSQRHLQGNQ